VVPASQATRSATSSGSISRLIADSVSITFSTTSSCAMPWMRAWSAICFSTSGVRT
jgi:hypothetical protein